MTNLIRNLFTIQLKKIKQAILMGLPNDGIYITEKLNTPGYNLTGILSGYFSLILAASARRFPGNKRSQNHYVQLNFRQIEGTNKNKFSKQVTDKKNCLPRSCSCLK